MRISTHQAYITGLNGILNASEQNLRTQRQISSGKAVLTPADDPVASTRILQLNQDIAIREVYVKNITSVTNRLSLEESVLAGVSDVMQRVREITLQAGDGSLTINDRQFLAEELDVRLEELEGLLNTREASGEYLFAGFKGTIKPFINDGVGGFKFVGDEGQRSLQVGASTFIPTGDSGKSIFEDITSVQNTFKTTPSPLNTGIPPAVITVGEVRDQAAYDNFYPEDAIITFNDIGDIQPPEPNYTVRRRSDNRVIEGLVNVKYSTGVDIAFAGIAVKVAGEPKPGDDFFVDSSKKVGLLNIVQNLERKLKIIGDSPEGKIQLQQLLEDSITNLDNAQTSLLQTRSRIGGRLNTVDDTKSLHEDVELVAQEILSQLQDVDFAKAVSQLSLESFVLEAAQSSFARINNLSLFNNI